MSLRKLLGKVFILGFLEVSSLCGVPIRPDEIEMLLKVHERLAVTHVIRNDDDEPVDRVEGSA